MEGPEAEWFSVDGKEKEYRKLGIKNLTCPDLTTILKYDEENLTDENSGYAIGGANGDN